MGIFVFTQKMPILFYFIYCIQPLDIGWTIPGQPPPSFRSVDPNAVDDLGDTRRHMRTTPAKKRYIKKNCHKNTPLIARFFRRVLNGGDDDDEPLAPPIKHV